MDPKKFLSTQKLTPTSKTSIQLQDYYISLVNARKIQINKLPNLKYTAPLRRNQKFQKGLNQVNLPKDKKLNTLDIINNEIAVPGRMVNLKQMKQLVVDDQTEGGFLEVVANKILGKADIKGASVKNEQEEVDSEEENFSDESSISNFGANLNNDDTAESTSTLLDSDEDIDLVDDLAVDEDMDEEMESESEEVYKFKEKERKLSGESKTRKSSNDTIKYSLKPSGMKRVTSGTGMSELTAKAKMVKLDSSEDKDFKVELKDSIFTDGSSMDEEATRNETTETTNAKTEVKVEKDEQESVPVPEAKEKKVKSFNLPSAASLNSWSRQTSENVASEETPKTETPEKSPAKEKAQETKDKDPKPDPKEDEKRKKKEQRRKLKNKIKIQNPIPIEPRMCAVCKKRIDINWSWKNICSYDCISELAELEYNNFYSGKGPFDKSSRPAGDIHLYLERMLEESLLNSGVALVD